MEFEPKTDKKLNDIDFVVSDFFRKFADVSSERRNPILANVLKPVFRSTPTQFQTTIFASIDMPNVGDVSEMKLTERQQKVLNFIKESPTISGRKMSEMLSVSQRTVERDISLLKKMGVLKREGTDTDGVWRILI